MAGQQGTPTGASPSVFSLPQQGTADVASPAVQQPSVQQPAMGGGKEAGEMRPQKTAMGTPIVYGNTYLNNGQYQPFVPPTGGGGGGGGFINPFNPSNPVNPVIEPPSYYETNFADGTMSVPGYAYGSTGIDDDPWAWTKTQPMSAPMGADIKPSTEQALARMPDKTEQQLGGMLMGKGVEAAATGATQAAKAYSAAAPLAASQAAAADLALGVGGSGAAVAAPTAAASGAAMAGGEAALAALGPVGMVIGGALLAKKLGIF